MGQGWKRLPLIVVFLMFWKTSNGFKGGAYSNAHYQWHQPYDTFSPRAVQSSMSEARVTGTLPVEEVGSTLFPNKPLKSRSKLNLLQFVKGGSNSYQSMSHAQTAPSSSASASLLLPPVQQPSNSWMSSGSTIPGVASGLSLETQYAASGFGRPVSTQGESSSYPAKLGVSGQSTNDVLHVSSSRETSRHQSAEASLPALSQQSISYSSSSTPGANYTSQSSPVLLSSGQPVSSRGEGSYSGLSQGVSSPYTSDSSTKLSSTISHQSSVDKSSPSLFSSSSQGSSGTFLASGSSFLEKVTRINPVETSSQPLPLVVSNQSTNRQSSPSLHVVGPQSSFGSKSTDAAASPYIQGSVSYSSLSSQAQGSATSQGSSGAELSASSVQSVPTQVGSDGYSGVSESLTPSSLYTSGNLQSNKFDALPLGVSSQSTSAQGSTIVSASNTQSRSGMQLATSSHVPVQGGTSSTSLSFKPQGSLGQYIPTSPTKYTSGPTSSRTSYRAVSQVDSLSQMGASGLFPSRGGNYYSGLLPQSQATSSQYALGYSKPISSPQITSSQSASVLSSHKQYTSTSQGSSGPQFGASTSFASQGMSSSSGGSVQSQGSSSLYCKCALSPLEVDSQTNTVHGSRKHFTSSYGTQLGSSTPFTLQGSITYDGSQPEVTASQFAPVSHSYPSALSPSQGVASQPTIHVSRKRLASTYTGSSGTQAGSSTPFTLQGSTAYSGSPQPQDIASQFSPGSQSTYGKVPLSSPQADPSSTVQGSRKQFTSTLTSSSGTQAGSSTTFTLQGSTAYGGSSPPQDAASQVVSGSSSPYASGSLYSPQGIASQSSQAYQGYSVSQSQKSQRWQPLAPHWRQVIQTSDAAASQGRSSQSSPMQFSSLSSAGGLSSRISSPFVSAQGGSTSYGRDALRLERAMYTPGSQLLPYDPSVAGQGTSSASASAVLSSYNSVINQNAPAPSRSSSSSRFYSVKG